MKQYKHFITNQEKLVVDIMHNALPYCDKLHFLVGYFYFSGFKEIYKDVGLYKNLRILVGLEAESKINSFIEYSNCKKNSNSNQMVRDVYFENVKKIISEHDEFDNKESLDSFNLFIKKLKNGTLEVRKTIEPSHAKMYLLEISESKNQNGDYLGTSIIGSSNFSFNGFRNNFEINIFSKENDYFEEGKDIFETLWEKSTTLANKNNIKEVEEKLVNQLWFNKQYSPFLIYVRILIEYFSIKEFEDMKYPKQILGENFINLKYQTDSIKKALEIITDHNGVIVADVVGLGKSVIAATIAENLGLATIIITPPHLEAQWNEYSDKLSMKSKVFTNGKIDEAINYSSKMDELKLIIIDEAHRYRNSESQTYNYLETLCRGNKIILLTATPFNNRPQDIFSLIRLFQIPQKSTIKTVENLSREFSRINDEYKKLQIKDKKNKHQNTELQKHVELERIEIAEKIKNLISPVVIRRNRKDIEHIQSYREDLEKQNIKFPIIENPKITNYDLGSLKSNYICSLEKMIGDNNSFIGARYKPTDYLKEESKEEILKYLGFFGAVQSNIAKFMKRLLVRRFESSVFSFQKTLETVLESHEKMLNFYTRNHRVIVSKKTNLSYFDDIDLNEYHIDTSDADVIMKSGLLHEEDCLLEELYPSHLTKEKEEEFSSKGICFIHEDYLKPEFLIDMKKDIDLLKDLQSMWVSIMPEQDPKLQCLKKILKEQLKKEPKRKIILFSEFADTINYLTDNLTNDKDLKIISYQSGLGNNLKDNIRADFDASWSENRTNNYNVLLTTDALSEGVNLNRAGTIFNYDIPYNPTRVIQRVGRINRINKKMFEKLYIYNYFPTEIGENETNIKKISTSKMNMIGLILGEDTKYLTEKEKIGTSQIKLFLDESEIENWETKYIKILENIKRTYPNIYEEALNMAQKSRIRRECIQKTKGVLIFAKRGNSCVFSFFDAIQNKVVFISDEMALNMFEACQEEKSKNVSDVFYHMYELAKENLFVKKIGNKYNKFQQESFKSLSKLKLFSKETDYLLDLERILKLDALCMHKLRQIQNATKNLKINDFNCFMKNINSLKQQIPYDYIKSVLKQEQDIETKKDIIILSEEFN